MPLPEVTLIRHAPSLHASGIVPPRDPPADTGAANGDAIAACARALPARANWWVSPLIRCRMTADALLAAGAFALEVDFDSRLAEQDYGDFHGRAIADAWEEIKTAPPTADHFLHHDVAPPGGESFTTLHERIAPVVADMKSHAARHLVIVSHAMVIRSVIAHASGMPHGEAYGIPIAPLSLTRIVFGGGGDGDASLASVNETFG